MTLTKPAYSSFLPDGFTAVKYIQSSGTQYIDTGRKLTQESDITIDFSIVDTIYRDAGVFGSCKSSLENNISIFQQTLEDHFAITFSDDFMNPCTFPSSLRRTTIRVNKTGVWHDDFLAQSWSDIADFETPTNGLIFDVGNNWTGNKAIMRLYSYADGDKQLLIPCLNADGVPCLYDIIGKTTFYNQGTGSFTWGD